MPFPEIYDWTFGEVVEFIKCRDEADRHAAKLQANLLFKTAALAAKMSNGKAGTVYKVAEEFAFLWTDEERAEMRREELRSKLRVAPLQSMQ